MKTGPYYRNNLQLILEGAPPLPIKWGGPIKRMGRWAIILFPSNFMGMCMKGPLPGRGMQGPVA